MYTCDNNFSIQVVYSTFLTILFSLKKITMPILLNMSKQLKKNFHTLLRPIKSNEIISFKESCVLKSNNKKYYRRRARDTQKADILILPYFG